MAAHEPVLRAGVMHSLVAVLAATLLPHVPHLPPWCQAACGAFFALRLWLTWRGEARPAGAVLVALALASAAGILLGFGSALGRDAAVALLALMLGLKLLETRHRRDLTVCVCLGYFLLVTDFLYTQSIPTALYTTGLLLWLTATMIAGQDRNRSLRPRQCLRMAAGLLLQGTPLMLALFFLFPRVNGPLWGVPQPTNASVTGLTDQMSPGTITHLGRSDAVAFRVEFRSPVPARADLYWRGPVLWDFDGRTWKAAALAPRGPLSHRARGAPVSYTVTLEPHAQRWLFAIDLPRSLPPGVVLTGDYQLFSEQPVRNRIRYDIASDLRFQYGVAEEAEVLMRALRLPEGLNPRARDLAQQILREQRDPTHVVQEVLHRFRTQMFYYTLEPPPLGRHAVDDFLFQTRRGFCEHYASAFVFLMRAAGIPARVVTGYQGGELNPVGDYLIVRQSEAHAWAEVWFQGQGWVRVDPTAAVSPARIQAGVAAAAPEADPLAMTVRENMMALRGLAFTWDAVANAWNQWVLGYSAERQFQLLREVGFDAGNWRTLALLLLAVTGSLLAALAVGLLRRLRPAPADPAQRAWERFCRRLARRGLRRRPQEGPRDFALRAATALPSAAADIEAIATAYLALRYAPSPPRGLLQELRARVRRFHPGAAP